MMRRGVFFPPPIAPFEVVVNPLEKSGKVFEVGERMYQLLKKEKFDVLLDDRNESPGRKFKDLDLVGIPVRITIGKKYLETGMLEISVRWEDKKDLVNEEDVVECVQSLLSSFSKRK